MDRVTTPFSRTDNKMGGYDAVALTANLGPSYQAALGAMALADDPEIQQQSDLYGRSAAEEVLLNLPEVQTFADGGLATDPEAAMLEGAGPSPEVSPADFAKGLGQTVYGLGKGATQAALGMPGDAEKFGRVLMRNENPTIFPTSDEVKAKFDQYLPNYGTPQPGLEGRTPEEFLGEFLDISPIASFAGKALKAAPGAAKNLLTSEPAYRLAEKLTAPAQLYAVPQSAVKKAEPIFEKIPQTDFDFVSKVDDYAASMPTQTKEQLLGYVKKNFKEHDRLRVERALGDLAPTDKVDASTLINAIHDKYNPAGYRTTVLSPKEKSYFQGIDNPFPDKPLGVIHLTEDANIPRPGQVNLNDFKKNSEYLFSPFAPPSKSDYEQWASFKALIGDRASPATKKALEKADNLLASEKKVAEEADLLSDLLFTEKYRPDAALANRPEFMRGYAEIDRLPYRERQIALEQWNAQTLESAQNRLRELTNSPIELPMSEVYARAKALQQNSFSGNSERSKLLPKRKEAMDQVLASVKNDPNISGFPSFGGDPSHKSLQAPGQPILFSRFSEHTISLPDLGKVDGIYVTELQSDRLDALRKMGSDVPGQRQRDVAQFGQMAEQLPAMRAENMADVPAFQQKAEALSQRVLKGTYDVPEAFAGMTSNSPQVQILAVKNAVNGAIKMGKQFVAFTPPDSAFSAQPQLYQKLEHNVKQVVKDLGSGFEALSITLPDATNRKSNELQPLTTWGIVWSPEVQKKGLKAIPFKRGGSVARQMLDNL